MTLRVAFTINCEESLIEGFMVARTQKGLCHFVSLFHSCQYSAFFPAMYIATIHNILDFSVSMKLSVRKLVLSDELFIAI